MKTRLIFLTFIIVFFLIGCGGKMQLEDFKNTLPKFDPKEYFNGKMTAYGLVKDRSGKIIRTFKGTLIGSWDSDGIGTLDEKFIYNDGEELERVWTLKPTGEKTYDATAGDIVGVAKMQSVGNTTMIDYVMTVPYNDSTINISVKDWLHLQEDGVIINHSKMKKFGFTVGELVITIIKDFPRI